VSKFANFQEGMSQVGAATMATAEEQDKLADSALDAGASSVYSAREAADAQTELAKAGVSVNSIIGGALTGSLALAAAGQLGVARAAEIAATTLTVFGLKGKDAGHVADLLAAGAGKAQGSVDDLALGLDYVGVTFARLNIPLEDTVGTLALLASNGLLGEKAGTGLRSVISSLTAPVAKGAEAMATYGINVYDAQKNFIGMAGVAEQLKNGLGGLDEQTRSAALGAIFGAEAASAAGILYAAGADGVNKWTSEVNEAGYAQEQARRMTDNLTGDIERLGGSFDSALIKTGSGANDSLRGMVQTLTDLVDWYASLDDGVQSTVLWLGIGVAAVALLGGTFMLAVPKIVEFRAALTTLNTKMQGTAIAGGAIGLALTAAVIILGAFAANSAEAAARSAAYGDTLDATTNKITRNTRELAKTNLALKGTFLGLETGADSAYDAADRIGLSLSTVTDAATGNASALEKVRNKLAEIKKMSSQEREDEFGVRNGSDAVASAQRVADAVAGESGSIENAIKLAEQKQSVDGDSADSNELVAASYTEVEDAVDGVITSLSDLAKEIDAANGKNLDAREAARALEGSYRDFDAALAENGKHLNEAGNDLDITSEKGAAMQAALDDIAKAALESGEAIIDAGGGYEDYKASLESSRTSLEERIEKLGITGQAATELRDKILTIPTEAQFTAVANIETAMARVDTLRQKYASIGGLIMNEAALEKKENPSPYLTRADGGKVDFFANGGRSENHVAQFARAGTMRVWAEPETGGEWYIPAAAAKRGRSTEVLAAAANEFGYSLVPAGAQAFADGGRAGSSVTTTTTGGNTYVQVDIQIPAGPTAETQAEIIARELANLVKELK
jgi:TP901 family phage tail tape measure protein